MTELYKSIALQRFQNDRARPTVDQVAIEEPLEIRIAFGSRADRKIRSLAVTMRTPGSDFDLAIGFLLSEGIVRQAEDIDAIRFGEPFLEASLVSNSVEVELAPSTRFEMGKLQRNFYTTSSCGICGKASLEAIRLDVSHVVPFQENQPAICATWIKSLPDRLREQQAGFRATGGLHAAAIVQADGNWLAIREDVGRHNAVDKVIGSQLLNRALPLSDHLLLLSGRASFELIQKAIMAQIPIVVAVGAPSSLAVELAVEFGVTLVGFTSHTRFNLYSGSARVYPG
jgi:FdhD protein